MYMLKVINIYEVFTVEEYIGLRKRERETQREEYISMFLFLCILADMALLYLFSLRHSFHVFKMMTSFVPFRGVARVT